MESYTKEELEETMKEVEEVKTLFDLNRIDEALLLLIYNEMINKDSLLREMPQEEKPFKGGKIASSERD